jgi:hypothetical protein
MKYSRAPRRDLRTIAPLKNSPVSDNVRDFGHFENVR